MKKKVKNEVIFQIKEILKYSDDFFKKLIALKHFAVLEYYKPYTGITDVKIFLDIFDKIDSSYSEIRAALKHISSIELILMEDEK